MLKTYGLLGIAYTSVVSDHHLVDLQKEMGVQINEMSEVSLVVGNFMETIIDFPISSSGNYQALDNSSFTFILKTKGKVDPETIFDKFDRWASGPAFHSSEIDRFRKDRRIEPDKIEEMSKARRIKRDVYASLEVSEKVGNITLFTIPASAFEEIFVNQEINQQKIFMGIWQKRKQPHLLSDLGIGCSPFLLMKTNPWIQE